MKLRIVLRNKREKEKSIASKEKSHNDIEQVDESVQEALDMDEYLEQLVARNNPDLMKRINSLKKENPSEEKPKLKKKSKVEHEKPRRSNTGDFEEAKDKTK